MVAKIDTLDIGSLTCATMLVRVMHRSGVHPISKDSDVHRPNGSGGALNVHSVDQRPLYVSSFFGAAMRA